MAYQVSDCVSAVQDDIDPSFSSTRIIRYLDRGQKIIFNRQTFKFCEKLYTGSLSVGSPTFTQQSDHVSTIGGVVYDASNPGQKFVLTADTYLPHRDFFDQTPDPTLNTSGLPGCWTEFGSQIFFDRPVDKAYTFKQRYIRRPNRLSATSDVPDLPEDFSELLELYAKYRAEKFRGNHDIAATYLQDFDDDLEDMALRYGDPVQLGPTEVSSNRERQDAAL